VENSFNPKVATFSHRVEEFFHAFGELRSVFRTVNKSAEQLLWQESNIFRKQAEDDAIQKPRNLGSFNSALP